MLKDTLSATDIDHIRRATDSLATSVQELGKRLYESAGANGSGTAGPGTTAGRRQDPSGAAGPNDDEVVDAEIVDEHGA